MSCSLVLYLEGEGGNDVQRCLFWVNNNNNAFVFSSTGNDGVDFVTNSSLFLDQIVKNHDLN